MSRHRRTQDATELGGTAGRALGWSLLNTAVGRLGTVAIGITLARLLGPSAFGTFAIATVALLAVLSFNEMGISLAIVRWPGDPYRIAPTVTTLSVATSSLLFAGVWWAAPAFSDAMGDAGATPVVRLMSVCILINALTASPAALMQREFMQKQRMIIDQVGVWLSAGLSIALAIAGMGAMSLAVGRVAASAVTFVMFVMMAPGRLRFGFDASLVRPLLKFGLPLAGASAVVFVAGNADQLVAGGVLGSTELGFYVLAFNLASWPIALFSAPLRSVAPAMFSKIQDSPELMAATFGRIAGLLAAVAIPVCVFIAAAAHPIVDVLYGPVWARSANVLMWLALLAAVRILFELAYDFLVIHGRSGAIFAVQIVWTIVLCPWLWAAALISGLAGIAFAQLMIAVVIAAPLYLRYLYEVGVPTIALVRKMAPAIALSIVLWFAVDALAGIDIAFLACVAGGIVALSSVALLVFFARADVAALRHTRSENEVVA